MTTAVSILMNCHNCSRYLKESIDSIYAQTYQDFEIIFIDNCSDDGTKIIVDTYDPRLKYYQTPHFMTLGEARSFGLQYCKSKYLAFLDTDDAWNPMLLEKSLEVLEDERKDYSMTYGNIAFIDEKSKIDKVLFQKKMPSGDIFRNLIQGYFITQVSVVLYRHCVKEVGNSFNKEYQLAADLELFLKIAHKYKIKYIDDVLAKVRKHRDSLTSQKFEKFPVETERFINELRGLIPDFDTMYQSELDHLNITMKYQYGIAAWMEGDKRKAREKIKEVMFKRKKYFLVYLLTVFDYLTYFKLMKFFKVGNY